MTSTDNYLSAMSASHIPAAESGLWFVAKTHLPNGWMRVHEGDYVDTPPGTYTYLRYLTDSTLLSGGELIMEDTPHELKTHLGFVMQACGKVLITGLGLGCVIRGLLLNPNVEHVTCIENSKDVLKLVSPYMPTERLTVIEAEALEWTAKNKQTFDCAWHDLWTNEEKGEPHLDIWHANLFLNCKRYVKRQGAWAFRKDAKALLVKKGFPWIG
jgi:hypothetical protein